MFFNNFFIHAATAIKADIGYNKKKKKTFLKS